MRSARRASGATIAEVVAVMMLILPLLIFIMLCAFEASYCYVMKSSLSEAAREAARNLAIAYTEDPTIVNNRSMQDSKVFSKIRIPNMVHHEDQFDDAKFDLSHDPPVVVVTVRYKSNEFGLPIFPHPDPLQIAGKTNVVGSCVFRLLGE